MHLRSDDIMGIMYPSITRDGNADNLALLPSFVNRGLRLVGAEALRIRQWNRTNPDAYGLADLESVGADGALSWMHCVTEPVRVSKEGSMAMIKPGDVFTFQGADEILLNGRRYTVRSGFTLELVGDDLVVKDDRGVMVEPG